MRMNGVEWIDVARFLGMNMKDFIRRLNGKQATPAFRRNLLHAIDKISQRPEDYYDSSGDE